MQQLLRTSGARSIGIAAFLAATSLFAGALAASTSASTHAVVVERGAPVEITFAAAMEFPDFSAAFENAVRLAIEQHPAIRGFPVRLNVVETMCGGDNAAAAASIVANPRNTALIGHVCSDGFHRALPLYEAAGVVTLTGSATADDLPRLGPTVFNRTIVRDGDGGEAWIAAVLALPSARAWSLEYEARFGAPPHDLAVFYHDAALLLLRRLQETSAIVDGALVVDRAELARAVRETTKFQGVTCRITLDEPTGNRVNDGDALARCAGD